jgi:hypothetical protein
MLIPATYLLNTIKKFSTVDTPDRRALVIIDLMVSKREMCYMLFLT